MNSAAKTRASKLLSYILRHCPEDIGLSLDDAGWGSVDALLEGLAAKGDPISLDELREIVYTSPKKRFEFDETRSNIRARQGHSIEIDLGYEPIEPPKHLYHGTPITNIESILSAGIDKRARHHVHMSTNKQVMLEAAARRGVPTLIEINATQMYHDGYQFFRTENEVWLTEFVPPNYCTHLSDFRD